MLPNRFLTVAVAALALTVPCLAHAMEHTEGKVEANGIEIAYETLGFGDALLFVQGVGGVIPEGPDPLSRALVDRGFCVIMFDNRDSGSSTHLDDAGMPDFEAIHEALASGKAATVPYSLDDMSADAVGLLDALDIERAHIVGGSLGGMIAQLIAAEHPQRTASLTLISSTTGNPDLPQGEPPTGDGPVDPATARQAAAATVAGDLRERSSGIEAPTVVIQGDADELFPPAHGRNLEATIPEARLIVVSGMGHIPEQEHTGAIVEAITSVSQPVRGGVADCGHR